MYNYQKCIGLEIHIALNTKTKMFSNSNNSHNEFPNTFVNPTDLAFPGTLPSPNREAVYKALVLAKALNMEINHILRFDRKHYFYQDLPKGFQITQQFFPIAKNGFIEIEINNKLKKIIIERFHLEEDTAKQIINKDEILLDYNRAGSPLIEIVTKPEFHDTQEVFLFLKKIKNILQHNNISDAKMEDGSMRVDVNMSIRPYGADFYGQRVEIKNINSLNNVVKAIEYEFLRQVELLTIGEKINNETRRFDDNTEKTIFMRKKDTIVDYCYMIEPNIIPINLNKEFNINKIKAIDLDNIKSNLSSLDLEQDKIEFLVDNYLIYKKLLLLDSKIKNIKNSYNILCVDFKGILSKENLKIEDIHDSKILKLYEINKCILEEKISAKNSKELMKLIINSNLSINKLITDNNLEQINDENLIRKILIKLIEKNNKILEEYKLRPERVEKFFIGNLMKETNGKANPNIGISIFKTLIKNK